MHPVWKESKLMPPVGAARPLIAGFLIVLPGAAVFQVYVSIAQRRFIWRMQARAPFDRAAKAYRLRTTARTVDDSVRISPACGLKREDDMRMTTARMAAAMLVLGVALGGCATREDAEKAQQSADLADRHAGTAQARADEAYGVGNNALNVGNNALGTGNKALSAAQVAQQKSDQNATEVAMLKRKVALLEHKVFPKHKKRHLRHHKVLPHADKATNS